MIQAILTDIEGTTTSLAFVKEVLFPHARRQMAAFIDEHRHLPEVRALMDEATRLADLPEGTDDADLVARLVEWIDQDRKLTPLKALQGMIWAQGYARGEFHGHLYPDAVEWIKAWHQQGYKLGVYSSGSVPAQKLLFAHTAWGDLTPLFSHYFDTRVGSKQETRSYHEIARQVTLPAEQILFLSDLTGELDAAREAGLATCQLLRDETAARSMDTGHPIAHDFSDVARLLQRQSAPNLA